MSAATRLPLSIRETPQSVSVVTRKRMDDQNMTTLEDAMEQVTGVNVFYETSDQPRFYSRGFSMDKVQENGVSSSFQGSVSGMGSAEASSESADLAVYDRVEVLRGASGLTQGSGEPGGTVNLVRKAPTREFQASANLGTGSWDNHRSELDVSGPLNDDGSLRGRFVSVYQNKQSFIDYIQRERYVLFGNLAYDLTPDTTLSGGVNWQKTHSVPDLYGVPMSTDYSSLGLSRSTYLGASWNNMTYEKINGFAELTHYFNSDWKLSSNLNYTRSSSNGEFIGIFGNGTNGVGSSGTGRLNNFLARDNEGYQYGLNIDLNGAFSLLDRQHNLSTGVDYLKERYDNLFGRVINSSTVNVFDWKPSSLSKPDIPYTNRYRYDNYQRGAYLTLRVGLTDTLKLILGGRFSQFYFRSNFKNLTTDRETVAAYRENGKATSYGGLVWDFSQNLSWYASYTDIFKPQNVVGESGSVLKPLTGENYETGIKGEFFDKTLNVSAAVFHLIQENRAMSNGDPNCDNNCYVASGKVRSRGLELEASGALTSNWQVFAGYSFTRSEYRKDESNSIKAGDTYAKWFPKHLFRISTDYRFSGKLERWSLGAGLTTQSSTDSTYDVYQGGYTLYNANAAYRIGDNLTLTLVGNNLSDKKYYIPVSNRHRGGNNLYGEPRNTMLTLRWQYH
nr:TonB-dependent siderophore receptor [Azomonas macrocytogenes]